MFCGIDQQLSACKTITAMGLVIGARRNHGLLGQSILNANHISHFQIGEVLAIVGKDFDWNTVPDAVWGLLDLRDGLIAEFDRKAAPGNKFADLHDEDHDLDPADAKDGEMEFYDWLLYGSD